jgi:outer membrane protein assembly factor BamB
VKHRFGGGLLACLLSTGALAQVVYDFENQQVPALWGQAPAAEASWGISSTHAASGTYSLRSESVGHGAHAGMRWNIGFLPGDVLAFKVRTETIGCCDTFQLLIDDQVVHSLPVGADTQWHEVREAAQPGNHAIEFRYVGASGYHTGAGAAWIDDVRVGPPLPVASPMFEQAGTLAVSVQGWLLEARLDSPTLRTLRSDHHGPVAFGPTGELYIAEHSYYSPEQTKLVRFTPWFQLFNVVASPMSLQSLAALDDRLIGARAYQCGAYSSIFYASGNVFTSPQPNPCEENWTAVTRRGANLFVLQGSKVTRRPVASPGTVTTLFTRGHFLNDIAVAADGTFWLLEGNALLHLEADGRQRSRTEYSGRTLHEISLREDGLIALGGSNSIGFVQPDHGYAAWRSLNLDTSDIAFRPGVVADHDGDTLPLWWEQAYGLDPEAAADAALDGDGDGLTNLQEFAFRSAPDRIDTDGDGAVDAVEHAAQSNPQSMDSDGDGLSDGIELLDLASNPNSIDSDADGMGDYYEFNHGLDVTGDDRLADFDGDGLGNFDEFQRGTNPALADSDADGLDDGAEVMTHQTDPLDTDSDDDGLGDEAEIVTHLTDPLDADSDGDSLGDELEVMTLHSNPNLADSDADGMPDGWEHRHAFDLLDDDAALDADSDGLANLDEFTRDTDPTDADSDNDAHGDGAEVASGTNPRDPDSDDDRVPDGWEVVAGYDPLVSDAGRDGDGDGFDALEEFWWGSLEEDASSRPVPLPWSTQQGNPRHNGYQPLRYRLERGVLAGPNLTAQGADRSVTGAGRIVYTQGPNSFQNVLVALDSRTGAEAWRVQLEGNTVSPPALHDGIVYVQTGRDYTGNAHLLAHSAATGELVFKAPFEAQWQQYLAPTISGDHVYINGGQYGGAYAFDRFTGAPQWFSQLQQYDRWTPAVDANRVYAYTGGDLDILDRATGVIEATVSDPLFSWNGYTVGMAPVLGGYGNVIVCQRGHMTVFDTLAPAVAWTRTDCGGPQPAAANGLVFMRNGNQLLAVNEIDGSTAWTRSFDQTLRDNIVLTPDHAIVSAGTQTHFVRLSDRRIVASVPGAGEKALTENGELVITSSYSIVVHRLAVFDPAVTIFFDTFD